jgi:hypothetical protein
MHNLHIMTTTRGKTTEYVDIIKKFDERKASLTLFF